jgi:hypothetical protein
MHCQESVRNDISSQELTLSEMYLFVEITYSMDL